MNSVSADVEEEVEEETEEYEDEDQAERPHIPVPHVRNPISEWGNSVLVA